MFKILMLTLVFIAVVGCVEAAPRPGEEVVYDRIEGMTDCTELAEQFQQATENYNRLQPGSELWNVSFSYAEAALDRMEELDCP